MGSAADTERHGPCAGSHGGWLLRGGGSGGGGGVSSNALQIRPPWEGQRRGNFHIDDAAKGADSHE